MCGCDISLEGRLLWVESCACEFEFEFDCEVSVECNEKLDPIPASQSYGPASSLHHGGAAAFGSGAVGTCDCDFVGEVWLDPGAEVGACIGGRTTGGEADEEAGGNICAGWWFWFCCGVGREMEAEAEGVGAKLATRWRAGAGMDAGVGAGFEYFGFEFEFCV